MIKTSDCLGNDFRFFVDAFKTKLFFQVLSGLLLASWKKNKKNISKRRRHPMKSLGALTMVNI